MKTEWRAGEIPIVCQKILPLWLLFMQNLRDEVWFLSSALAKVIKNCGCLLSMQYLDLDTQRSYETIGYKLKEVLIFRALEEKPFW